MKRGVFIFWSLFIAAAGFRLWQSSLVKPPNTNSCAHSVVHGTGRITEEPERKESAQVLVVGVETLRSDSGAACPDHFLLRMRTKIHPAYSYAEEVSFAGKMLQPMNFQSGDREFDYRGYLAKDDIFYEIRSAAVSHIERERPDGIFLRASSALFRLKGRFVQNLQRVLGEPHAALAAGLVVGEKAALGKDLIDDFRTVGLIHIVVLSGYNITLVGVAFRKTLSFLPRVWGIVIGGAGILLFGFMVGGGATVVRSCFMAGIALSADLIRREYNVTRALLLAALIMVIQNPLILFHDPSFQLSFLATAGLLLLASPIENKLSFIPDVFGMRSIVAATLATQLFVSPFILYTMGQISLIGMVVNILVLPFIPLTMILVFLCGAAGFVSLGVSAILGYAAHGALSYELFMVKQFARLPMAAAHLPPFSKWYVFAFYAVFLAGFIFLKLWRNFLRSQSN